MVQEAQSLRILYGVQATGQGHITRARSLGPALIEKGATVDYLFSGGSKDELFGMEVFGDFEVRKGLTFHFKKGQVSPCATVANNNLKKWMKDVKSLDLSKYDLIITDYEPITAWAAKLRKKPIIGIGNQYAFYHDGVPMKGFNKLTLSAMRHFAPAKTHLGIHWDHFGHQIIPPIMPLPDVSKEIIAKKIVVYLYFEDQKKLADILKKFSDHQFYIYSPDTKVSLDEGNLFFRPTSEKFKEDVENCEGVICGAGFGLPTECIHLGKKLLVKAMKGQPEQISNALAIQTLGLGMTMSKLKEEHISEWLSSAKPQKITFPDTAQYVADWILNGDWKNTESLVRELWDKTLRHE